MFVLNKCIFENGPGYAYFHENKEMVPTSNTYMDAFEAQSDAIEVNNTSLTYYYKSTSNATGAMDASYTQFLPDKKTDLEERKVILSSDFENKSYDMKVQLETRNPDVSPMIFHNRQNLVTIENKINSGGLRAELFNITNQGSGYTTNASISITSVHGAGANAYAVVNVTSGKIVDVIVDAHGSGYSDNVSAIVSGGGGTGGLITITPETGRSGGPAETRYISKTVTLIDGLDAGDLRVYLTAVKPPSSNIHVYYKVRNSLDPEKIEDRNWTRMEQVTSIYNYSTKGEAKEFEFRPSTTSNNIVYVTPYNTYRTFNQFAIKIVLTAEDSVASKIPYVMDVRAIALPEDIY
jgi:hypothetical protein